jgi:5-hydroxyisourate hydrolase
MSGVTSHVLDLTSGTPAAGVEIALEHIDEKKGWHAVARATTDADGRVKEAFAKLHGPGRYRLTFATGAYFAARGMTSFHPEVTVVFEVRDANEHHHVPLLLSPFGYSTYRGS